MLYTAREKDIEESAVESSDQNAPSGRIARELAGWDVT
jgi:hypothetical protein